MAIRTSQNRCVESPLLSADGMVECGKEVQYDLGSGPNSGEGGAYD